MASHAPDIPVSTRTAARFWTFASAILLFVAALALMRLLFEWRFPDLLWLGRPLPAILTAAMLTLIVTVLGRSIWSTAGGALSLSPLALNLLYLPQSSVDLAGSRILFLGSLWLSAVLLTWRAVPDTADRRWRWLGPLLIAVVLGPVYLLTMSHAVGAADTFEFQVVAPQLGIAHPTGYPFYLLLAKAFSLLPLGTIAWRINLASAVFAVLAAMTIYATARRLTNQPLAALAGATAWGLVPVVWGQAIVAEVYTLHALVVSAALWLMVALIVSGDFSTVSRSRRLALALAFVIGLGLANHLTSVFLIPPALLTGLFLLSDRYRDSDGRLRIDWGFLILLAAAFALPLLLYAYLPVRWQAVNGEPMGLERFVEWVAGGRFQGALQWMAWLRDPARYRIVGRLIVDAWGWYLLLWAVGGAIYLWLRQRRAFLILLLAGAGYTFYALNYYVPDLEVFLLPVHVVIAIAIAGGVAGAIEVFGKWLSRLLGDNAAVVAGLSFLLVAAPVVVGASRDWTVRDQSARDGGETWARGVLERPLSGTAAILADSEKIAPLYYLQQNEGLRPEMDISVLPDEAAYRAELEQRTAAGQTVYLARFLPGLARAYFLRSAGPLIEAGTAPLTNPPNGIQPLDLTFGPARLVGLTTDPVAPEDPNVAGVTLYWKLDQSLAAGEDVPVLYVRWASTDQPLVNGAHAVGNSYPLNAWRPGEVIADYHALPVPVDICAAQDTSCDLELELAWGPRFADANDLNWQQVGRIAVSPPLDLPLGQELRIQLGSDLLNGASFPLQARPEAVLNVLISGWGEMRPMMTLRESAAPEGDTGALDRPNFPIADGPPQLSAVAVPVNGVTGRQMLWAETPGEAAVCGWLAPVTTGCSLGQVEIAGAALPEGATNFADQMALLQVDIPQTELQPGGQLAVQLTWQGLAPMTEDYTVFVQVLDAQDRLVGQVDAWPVQGTFPTSQWTPGVAIDDPYVIQLSSDMPPGDYRLNIGMYLLATLQRLPVLNSDGDVVDDKVEIGGLKVAP